MIDINKATALMQAALLRDLGDDVDVIFRYGSTIRGNTHAYSDVDLAFVPARDDIWHSITVLVDDTLIDLFPLSWSRLTRIAEYDEVNVTILARSVVLYGRTPGAEACFDALVERVRRLQEPDARPEMLDKARAILQRAGYPFYLLYESTAGGNRTASLFHARQVLQIILHSLGVANQVALDTRKLDEVLALPLLPHDFAALLARVTEAGEPVELLTSSGDLLAAARQLFVAEQASSATEPRGYPDVFEQGYPELKGDLQHIILAAGRQDRFDLKLYSFYHELMNPMAEAERGIAYGPFNSLADYEQDLAALGFPDLVGPAVAGDYNELRRRCLAFDTRLGSFLAEREVALNTFGSLDELAEYLGVDV